MKDEFPYMRHLSTSILGVSLLAVFKRKASSLVWISLNSICLPLVAIARSLFLALAQLQDDTPQASFKDIAADDLKEAQTWLGRILEGGFNVHGGVLGEKEQTPKRPSIFFGSTTLFGTFFFFFVFIIIIIIFFK